ncbi:hypothetical protein BC829DRAFT_416515 [Chytridium lagenaria]|nr:hypothetical protein BC829DRAFT_416515 [Chytridium lagenaria]
MSDQLSHEVPCPKITPEVKVGGVVTNEAERMVETERARQWNEVEFSISRVLTEHMDSAMRSKFNSARSYESMYKRFKSFENSLHHDSGHTIEAIQGELKRIVQGSSTPLDLATLFEERRNKLVALGDKTVDDFSFYKDFLQALTNNVFNRGSGIYSSKTSSLRSLRSSIT